MIPTPMSFYGVSHFSGTPAADSLAGLSVGDPLGAPFFVPGTTADDLPPGPARGPTTPGRRASRSPR
jgi:hypothetical protein